MADNLNSSEMQAFCENVALMLSVGVQTAEATHMLAESAESKILQRKCLEVYEQLAAGRKLSVAMASAGGFPSYAIEMISAGEKTGRTQETLESLAGYYDEEGRLIRKIRQSVSYPAIILCIMSVVLAFVASSILPIFLDVYKSMSGGIATSSFSAVNIGIIIGWTALVLTLVMTLVALIALASSHSAKGRDRLMKILSVMPGAKKVFYDLALSRFTAALSVYIASGSNTDDAMSEAVKTIEMDELSLHANDALMSMKELDNPKSLVQALSECEVLDPMRSRMLTFGLRSGQVDEVLMGMSEDLFEESISGFDSIIDKIEPLLAGFVTIAVGLTLISVMLPLVGMMGAVG